jgi:Asp-tRNA(Asn)/Glu-tRNA(Gln) amidotransferase A subunit family amidase
MPTSRRHILLITPIVLATLPLPAGFTAMGLPLAVLFVGRHLGEPEVCRAGRAFQRSTGWHRRHPRD